MFPLENGVHARIADGVRRSLFVHQRAKNENAEMAAEANWLPGRLKLHNLEQTPPAGGVQSANTADFRATGVTDAPAVVQELRLLHVLASIFASVHRRHRDGAQRGDPPMLPWLSTP